MTDYKQQFKEAMGFSDEELDSLEERMAIPECWGTDGDGKRRPMTYKKLMEILERDGYLHTLTLAIYYSWKNYENNVLNTD